jgi:mRNA interferase MazF
MIDARAPIVDWKNAGLLKASLVKPVITTIEKSLVVKKLGALVVDELNEHVW